MWNYKPLTLPCPIDRELGYCSMEYLAPSLGRLLLRKLFRLTNSSKSLSHLVSYYWRWNNSGGNFLYWTCWQTLCSFINSNLVIEGLAIDTSGLQGECRLNWPYTCWQSPCDPDRCCFHDLLWTLWLVPGALHLTPNSLWLLMFCSHQHSLALLTMTMGPAGKFGGVLASIPQPIVAAILCITFGVVGMYLLMRNHHFLLIFSFFIAKLVSRTDIMCSCVCVGQLEQEFHNCNLQTWTWHGTSL